MDPTSQFFRDIIGAGAIVAGFASSFLAFRIQREASYYRAPWVDTTAEIPFGGTAEILKSHFTYSMVMSILAAVLSLLSGVVIPLLGLAGKHSAVISPTVAVAGIISSVVALAGYFFLEFIHYAIILNRPDGKSMKKRRQGWWLVVCVTLTSSVFVALLFWV